MCVLYILTVVAVKVYLQVKIIELAFVRIIISGRTSSRNIRIFSEKLEWLKHLPQC